jgi:hypothetical protein
MGGGSARGRGPQRQGGTRVEREKKRERGKWREGVNQREAERFIHMHTQITHIP